MGQTLYALLAGVSNYLPPVSKLPGAANDLRKIQEYLQGEKKDFQDVKIKTLVDKEAVKSNIVKEFREHLGQAKKGDVAFFFFSGHGTQEAADPDIWVYEPDRRLECLVCYDSVEEDSNIFNFLADKELRWLLHELWSKTQAHIVTVFDCCHSGENTRNVHVGQQVPEVAEKRLVALARFGGDSFPKRAWSDFIFSKDITQEDLKTKPLHQIIPEGRHVQLAACRNDESAYEVGGEGIFTKNLLDVLKRSRGGVTYFDMRSRIKNFIKNQYMQTPQIYVQGGDLALGFTTFLGKSEEGKPLYGNIVKNRDQGWVMDMGALHGISKRGQAIEVEADGDAKKLKAQVVSVFPDHTTIQFDAADEAKAAQAGELKGYVADFQSAPVKVYLEAEAAYKDRLEKLKKELDLIGNLYVTDKEYEADYCVVTRKEGIDGFGHLITYPGEAKYYTDAQKQKQIRPLVLPATSLIETLPEKRTAAYLKHIAQWEYVKNLHNPGTFMFQGGFPLDIRFEVSAGEGWEELPMNNEAWAPILQLNEKGKLTRGCRVRIRNKYSSKLYVSVVNLSLNFEVYPAFLNPPNTGLNPGDEKIIDTVHTPKGERPIVLSAEPEVLAFGLPYSPAWLLFIASTHENVDVTTLELPALPSPLQTDRTRAIGADDEDETDTNASDWITRLVELKIGMP